MTESIGPLKLSDSLITIASGLPVSPLKQNTVSPSFERVTIKKMLVGAILWVVFWNSLIINLGEALLCFKCHSSGVNSRCRAGKRKHLTTVKESCYGDTPQCYSYATVSDEGEPYFERGCSLDDLCNLSVYEDQFLEYCHMCTDKFCNNDFMTLDEEVEQYLQDQLSYTTEKTTPLPTTHSSDWYLKKYEHHAKLKMKPTERSTTNTVSHQTSTNPTTTYGTTVSTVSDSELMPESSVQEITATEGIIWITSPQVSEESFVTVKSVYEESNINRTIFD